MSIRDYDHAEVMFLDEQLYVNYLLCDIFHFILYRKHVVEIFNPSVDTEVTLNYCNMMSV